MIILHISPINMTSANGLRFSVPGLAASQNRNVKTRIGLLNVLGKDKLNKAETEKFTFDFFPEYTQISQLPEPYNHPDIVVFHGVYFFKYIQLYKYLKSVSIPYVIVPRVSLTRKAQQQKYIKKQIGNILFFNKFIKGAKKIHYLTSDERKISRSLNENSFVVGNGIELPQNSSKRLTSGGTNINFIGRYDINHKGLDILIEAISKIKIELIEKNVKINLYGTDYNNGKQFLVNKIKKYGLHDTCNLNNPVFGDEKKIVLENTDIFVSPSRFEGHPMSVIEAMANRIPCILTEGTNMLDVLQEYDAGWRTELTSESLAQAILESIEDVDIIQKKGENARKLVENNYSWDIIANKTISEYEAILKSAVEDKKDK